MKDYQGAIDDYNKSIEIDPKLAASYFNRAKTKSNLNNFQEAVNDYNKVFDN